MDVGSEHNHKHQELHWAISAGSLTTYIYQSWSRVEAAESNAKTKAAHLAVLDKLDMTLLE